LKKSAFKQFVEIMAWKKLFAVLLLANCVAIALSLPQQSKPKRPITVFELFKHLRPSLRYFISRFHIEYGECTGFVILFMIIEFFQPSKTGGLLLPDNATLIRENIVDTFSCQDRIYGYYADMENECQVFHVCMPQTRSAIRWSFICPGETVFNQVNW